MACCTEHAAFPSTDGFAENVNDVLVMVRAETGREGTQRVAEAAKAGSAGLAHGDRNGRRSEADDGSGYRSGSERKKRWRMLRDSPLGKEKREEEGRRQQRAMLRGAWGPPGAAEADRVGSGRACARALTGLGPWERGGACRTVRGNVTGWTELSAPLQYPPLQEPSDEEA
jgi:hypothetical protein